MGRRPLLAMALGWVLVVAAVAAVTFVVVDRAGRGVGQASAARTVAPLPSRSVSPPPSPGPATSTATPSSTPTPVTARSAAAPSPTRTSRQPAPTPTPTPTVRPAGTRTASFTTEGGTVVASCAGTVLTLGSITPRDGWRFEKESEHGGLEVKFTAREEDVDDVEIVLGCVRGTPTRLEG